MAPFIVCQHLRDAPLVTARLDRPCCNESSIYILIMMSLLAAYLFHSRIVRQNSRVARNDLVGLVLNITGLAQLLEFVYIYFSNLTYLQYSFFNKIILFIFHLKVTFRNCRYLFIYFSFTKHFKNENIYLCIEDRIIAAAFSSSFQNMFVSNWHSVSNSI